MRAGFAEIEYTPIQGFMPGEFDAFYARGAYTPLQANAAAFESNGETVILVSADHLSFRNEYADLIRQGIADGTGIPKKNVLLAATHTHMGPAYDIPFWKTPAEPEIGNIVANRIIKAGVEAFNNIAEGASLAVTTAEEKRFSFCRNIVMADGSIKTNPGYHREMLRTCDTPDQTIELMRVTRDDKTVAIMVNFANHPDSNGGRERNKFCADWPGFMRIALKEKYGQDVIVLFFNGCCGDVNHLDFINKTNLSLHNAPGVVTPECIGRGMADTICRALDSITETVTDESIAVHESTLTVNRRQITEEEKEWADEIMELSKTEYIISWKYVTALDYVNNGKNVPETEGFTVTGYRVGPWGMIALPGEMYTAVGRTIKQNSPFAHTVPVELANGDHGYVIPDNMRANGSYEGRFNSGTTGLGAMDIIIEGGIETLRKIY